MIKPPGKKDKDRPKKGIDDEVAMNIAGFAERRSLTKLKSAIMESIVFHELAEAYGKVEHNKQYAAAHGFDTLLVTVLTTKKTKAKLSLSLKLST